MTNSEKIAGIKAIIFFLSIAKKMNATQGGVLSIVK